MIKHTVLAISILILTIGCSSKPKVATTTIPSSGYLEELKEYEENMAKKKPTASLWSDVGSHSTLFLDYKARLVGDLVIVRVEEASSAKNSNNTATDKKANYSSGIDNIMGIPTDFGMTNFLNSGKPFDPSISASTANTWSGSGSKTRSDSISAIVTARVVQVLPSGNLVIEGQREIIIDQEKQTLSVRGVIRPKDIDSSNVVLSSAIADAQIQYYGDGVLSDANKKGWLARFIDWVWPF